MTVKYEVHPLGLLAKSKEDAKLLGKQLKEFSLFSRCSSGKVHP
jgi:hypothetical protein